MKTNIYLAIWGVLFAYGSLLAQVNPKGYSYDVGIQTGMSSVQSDFGENGDFAGETFGNLGFDVGANFYFGFINRRGEGDNHWFKNHTKLLANVSYLKMNIDHFGNMLQGSQGSLFRAMHTETSMLNAGLGLQYYIFNLSEFNPRNINIFSPYFGVNLAYNYISPKVSSDLGDIQDPNVLPTPYRENNTIFNEKISTFSVDYVVGSRVKISYNSDLDINLSWKNMLSDKLDGLVPQLPSNKHNDWLYTINIGYIFYLE